VSGTVKICMPDDTGRELQMGVRQAGDYFGELGLFERGVRTSTVRSIDPVQLLVLTHDAFHGCLRAHPSIAIRLLEVIGRRQRELLGRMRSVGNVNEIVQHDLTRWQRTAQFIANLAASRGFLLSHAVAFTGWIIANVALGRGGWDPYPFPFLCFWASVEAIFLSLFILVSQSMQAQKDRVRSEQDYQIAVKTQYELSNVHQKLDRLLERGDAKE
jgi:CRP/FNR family transcriptional regulator, cyclic AMP receptor protein